MILSSRKNIRTNQSLFNGAEELNSNICMAVSIFKNNLLLDFKVPMELTQTSRYYDCKSNDCSFFEWSLFYCSV